ncbi:uncharacterized protein [Procambarus clarkii]|uniref:uncharacterized protein n=1 Tax=Procambarus clarkii TaxID=6728 RepID=UPI0037422547
MNPMTSVMVTVALAMLVAGTTTAASTGGPGGRSAFPLGKCFTAAQGDNFKKQLCTDMGKTEAYCKDNEQQITTCRKNIITVSNSQALIQASAGCLQTVVGVTVPASSMTDAKTFYPYVSQLLDSNDTICSQIQEILTCFKLSSNLSQLIQDCLTKAGL